MNIIGQKKVFKEKRESIPARLNIKFEKSILKEIKNVILVN